MTRGEILSALRREHLNFLMAIGGLGDEDLSKPLPPPWGEGDTLEHLVAINSYEHEPEHTQQITAWRQTLEDDHNHEDE